MNKGYLMFLDDDSRYTIQNDDPEDLTHLAPTAGDVCIPLDVPSFPDYIFDDMLLPDHLNVCDDSNELLPELMGIGAGLDDPVLSNDSNGSGTNTSGSVSLSSDPFLSYRDDHPLSSGESDSLPQGALCKSISNSCDDLCGSNTESPPPLDLDDRFRQDQLNHIGFTMEQTAMLHDKPSSIHLDLENDEFELRAPYCPIGEDLPLLTQMDHMWSPDAIDSQPAKTTLPNSNGDSSNSALSRTEVLSTDKSRLAKLLQTPSPTIKTSRGHHLWSGPGRGKDALDGGGTVTSAKMTKCKDDGTRGTGLTLKGQKSMPSSGSKEISQIGRNTVRIGKGKQNIVSPEFPLHLKRNLQTNCNPTTTKKARLDHSVLNDSSGDKGGQTLTKNRRSVVHISTGSSPRRKTLTDKFEDKSSAISKDSVLRNLLLSGQDISNGYSCYTSSKPERKLEAIEHAAMDPAKLSPPTKVAHFALVTGGGKCIKLLEPEGGTVPLLLNISQQDAEVNAPIQASQHLLQGYDLLTALDQSSVTDHVSFL